jgi:DNA-binding CsgD family transcriptional regulator
MATITCTLFWVLAPLLILGAAIAWALETDRERAQRWNQGGTSQAEIGRRLGLNRYRVGKLLA